MLNMHYQLGCPTGDIRTLQPIDLVVFGAMDSPHASCTLVHFFGTRILNES